VVAGAGGRLRVLEIDARLPSQTPTVVYWSSGRNVVELLAEMASRGVPAEGRRAEDRACVYQHVRVCGGRLDVVGEHALAQARPLRLVPGFYGADEALTDRDPSATSWVATLVTTGATLAEAAARGSRVVEAIARLDRLSLPPRCRQVLDEERR
jgi:3-methylornithine--L-lysine ligase